MENSQVKNLVDEIKKNIEEVTPLLICDKFDDSREQILKIMEDANKVFELVVKKIDTDVSWDNLKIQWIQVLDVFIKAINIKDAIQLADIIKYDLVQVLEESIDCLVMI